MNKYKAMLLGYVVMFVIGYGYGIIDALSGFDKVQVWISAFAVIVSLIVILIFGPKDAILGVDEQ